MNPRSKFIIGISVIVGSVATLMWTAVDQTKMYMITVAQYIDAPESYAGTTVRVAGRVAEGSMNWDSSTRQLLFTLKDLERSDTVKVRYSGLLPDMFAEGRNVVVQGPSADSPIFDATTVLTSCPSKYEAEGQSEEQSGS